MKNKTILFTIIAAMSILCMNLVSAVIPNDAPYGNGIAYGWASYGSHPVNPSYSGIYPPYASTPVRIGGFFGGNSAFLIGLKPGFYDGPQWNVGTRYDLASRYYPRAGGRYTGGYGYNFRPGTFGYTGSVPSIYSHGAI